MAPKSSSSEPRYAFAAATGSSADIDDDFDWADDELPTATAATASAQAQPAPVAVKQGPIPFKAPGATTSTPAAQTAAAAPGPAQGRPAASAIGAQPAAAAAAAPKAAPASGAKPQASASKPAAPQAGPKPPLVRPPGPGPAAAPQAAGKGPSTAWQPAPPAAAAAGAGKPAAAAPAQKSALAGASAGPKTASPVAPTTTSSSSSSSSSGTDKQAGSTSTAQAAAAAAAAAQTAGRPAAPPATQPDSSAAPNSASSEIAPAPAAETAATPPAAADQAGSSSGAGAGSNNSSGGGSAKGWGGWLAPASLGGLSSKLQQVALGAAKDLQELTASVHQVVAEVVAADDITEVDRLAEYQPRPVRPHEGPTAATKPDAAPPAPVMASRDSSSQLAGAPKASGAGPAGAALGSPAAAVDLDPEEVKRREILHRLQGRDTQLESGLKVIDGQVDALAANAVKALGSLWGGLNTVAKTSWGLTTDITKKVEAAAKEMAKEVAVGLEEGASLVARAEKGLESVLGPRVTSGGGSQRSAADWESTFESCFELYGGTTATDELEELSSECAHICNNARAKLQLQQREQIDAMLSKLVPLFDPTAILQQQEGPDAVAVAAAAAVEAAGVEEATLDALDALYAPVVAACNKGKRKAAQLQSSAAQAAAAAAAAVAADSAASPRRQQQQQQQQQQGSDSGAADAAEQAASSSTTVEQGVVLDPVLQEHQRVCDALRELLQGVRSAAVKSLAEVAAGQIMVLLTMAQSVAALPRYGKPLADGLEWPSDAEAVGGLIRGKVQEMVADTRELAAAFAAAADKVAAHMLPAVSTPTPAAAPAAVAAAEGSDIKGEGDDSTAQQQQQQQQSPHYLLQQRAGAATAEVNADCQMALTHVRDSHGKLLYVVLLASLHRAGKEVPAQQQQQQEAQQEKEQVAEVQEQIQQAGEQQTQQKSD